MWVKSSVSRKVMALLLVSIVGHGGPMRAVSIQVHLGCLHVVGKLAAPSPWCCWLVLALASGLLDNINNVVIWQLTHFCGVLAGTASLTASCRPRTRSRSRRRTTRRSWCRRRRSSAAARSARPRAPRPATRRRSDAPQGCPRLLVPVLPVPSQLWFPIHVLVVLTSAS